MKEREAFVSKSYFRVQIKEYTKLSDTYRRGLLYAVYHYVDGLTQLV